MTPAEFNDLTARIKSKYKIFANRPADIYKSVQRIKVKLQEEQMSTELCDSWEAAATEMGYMTLAKSAFATSEELTEEKRAELELRLKEIGEEIEAKKIVRGRILTEWLLNEGNLLEEAYRIYIRIEGTEEGKTPTRFYPWAEEVLGYHEKFIAMLFGVRKHLLSWPEGMPLPPITMGMAPELARCPQQYVIPILTKELRTSSGEAYDEIPIRTRGEGPSLQKLISGLIETVREDTAKAKKEKELKKQEALAPQLSQDRQELEKELEESGESLEDITSELSPEERDDVYSQTRGKTNRINQAPVASVTNVIVSASSQFRLCWDTNKKKLLDSLDQGDVGEEGMEDLRKLTSLMREVLHSLEDFVK
jgi:hypothetical protein